MGWDERINTKKKSLSLIYREISLIIISVC
jgi:hypothetical protein